MRVSPSTPTTASPIRTRSRNVITTCHKKYLEARCNERGYTLEEVWPCVTAEHPGDMVTIDTNHPAYPKKRKGLGDHVAGALAAVGITEERVSRAIGRPCGCGRRRERLNQFGRRFGIG